MAPAYFNDFTGDFRNRNVLWHFDDITWGLSEEKVRAQLTAARKSLLRNSFEKRWAELQPMELAKLERRVTALTWHPKVPYVMSAASKGGAIVLGKGFPREDQIYFEHSAISEGTGPGGAIFSLKFDENCPNTLYTAGLSGLVQKLNLLDPSKHIITYDDTENFDHWYTGMDVSFNNNILAAGDNKGESDFLKSPFIDLGGVKLFDVRNGDTIQKLRLHKGKIHHCEFNKRDSNMLATGALDEKNSVCLWDIRNLKNCDDRVNPLKHFDDFRGANVTSFNSDGSRLLVNDQKDKIKVYQGPLWTDILTIDHPHRQFQHLTAIEASWHPLDDVIIIGRYPVAADPKAKPAPPRPIDFFDGQNGQCIHSLYHPANGIVSLNAFSPMGDVLASGMGLNVLLWQASMGLEKLSGVKKGSCGSRTKIPASMRSAVRGDNGDSGNDSEDDDISKIKKAAKRRLSAGKKKNPRVTAGEKHTKLTASSAKAPKNQSSSSKNVPTCSNSLQNGGSTTEGRKRRNKPEEKSSKKEVSKRRRS